MGTLSLWFNIDGSRCTRGICYFFMLMPPVVNPLTRQINSSEEMQMPLAFFVFELAALIHYPGDNQNNTPGNERGLMRDRGDPAGLLRHLTQRGAPNGDF